MINILFALAALGLSAQEVQSSPPTKHKTPTIRRSECVCTHETEPAFAILNGIVIDAEVTLSTDGLSPADRQATIINVTVPIAGVKGRTKIWHTTKPNQCGVTFDYGKKYSVAVRKTEQGLETDECLMRSIRTAN